MTAPILAAWRFVRQNDLPTLWRALLSRDAHPALQFLKYGLCGVAAALAHNGVMVLLSVTLFPAAKGALMDGQAISEALRSHHLVLNNALSWPFGTAVAYWLNILFVFTPGRHGRVIELLLFAGISALSFFPGAWWCAGWPRTCTCPPPWPSSVLSSPRSQSTLSVVNS